jgi:hypothetical protein
MTRDDLTFVVLVVHRLWERVRLDRGCPFCDRWEVDGQHGYKCKYLHVLNILEAEAKRVEDPICF